MPQVTTIIQCNNHNREGRVGAKFSVCTLWFPNINWLFASKTLMLQMAGEWNAPNSKVAPVTKNAFLAFQMLTPKAP